MSKKDRPKKPEHLKQKSKTKKEYLEDKETTHDSKGNTSEDIELRAIMANEIKRNLLKN